MKKELDEYLVATYAPLYQDRDKPMSQTCMCWGFEVGDGWFDLIEGVSQALCEDWLRAKYDYERLSKTVGRAPWEGAEVVTKEDVEKAKIKMDEAYANTPVASQVKEKHGTLRFSIFGGDERADAVIEFAEFMSSRVCEECGSPGRITKRGWMMCRCDDCRMKAGLLSVKDEKELIESQKGNDF